MTTPNFAAEQLRSFIARLERLAEEKQAIADDMKDVMAEAKSCGLDPKIIRKVLALRKQDTSEREEQEAILDLYLNALGMQMSLPLDLEDAA